MHTYQGASLTSSADDTAGLPQSRQDLSLPYIPPCSPIIYIYIYICYIYALAHL